MNVIARSFLPRFDRDAWWFVVPTLGIVAISAVLEWPIGIIVGLAIALLFIFVFFRDPPRVPPDGKNLVVAPADGIIVAIERAIAPNELEMHSEDRIRISIFLNLLDVHVNRIPISGKVAALKYRRGRFWSTARNKSSEENERVAIRIDTDCGQQVAVCQIAGPVVRRIRCDVVVNQRVSIGDKYGLIRFGSRTDLYVPATARVWAKVGQRAVGGETVVASFVLPED